jgi:hypothetical protein
MAPELIKTNAKGDAVVTGAKSLATDVTYIRSDVYQRMMKSALHSISDSLHVAPTKTLISLAEWILESDGDYDFLDCQKTANLILDYAVEYSVNDPLTCVAKAMADKLKENE